MKTFLRNTILLALPLNAFAGCGETSKPAPSANPPLAQLDGRSPTVELDAPSVSEGLRVVDADGLREYVLKQPGRVVLIDFWATWCPPCTESFSDTVALQTKYGAAGLQVAAVSLDDAKDSDKVIAFLDKHHAQVDRMISRYGKGADSMKEFNLPVVPSYHLYDDQGVLRYRFVAEPRDDQFHAISELEIRIRELLHEAD